MTKKLNFTKWLTDQLENAKAKDIVILDVRALTSITDYMVVCTGTSGRHIHSIADKLAEQAKKDGLSVIGAEGEPNSGWILVDLDDAIVHVMQQETRNLYQLEELWGQ